MDLLAIETRFEVPRGCAEVTQFGLLGGMNRCPLIDEISKLLQIVHEGRKNLQERGQCNTTQGKTVHRCRTSSLPPVLRSPTNISIHPAYLPPTAPTPAVPSRRNNRSSCPPMRNTDKPIPLLEMFGIPEDHDSPHSDQIVVCPGRAFLQGFNPRVGVDYFLA
jgi:hypothetical protein